MDLQASQEGGGNVSSASSPPFRLLDKKKTKKGGGDGRKHTDVCAQTNVLVPDEAITALCINPFYFLFD